MMPRTSTAIRYAIGGCEANADASTDSGDEAMLDECWAGADDGVALAMLRSRRPSSWIHNDND